MLLKIKGFQFYLTPLNDTDTKRPMMMPVLRFTLFSFWSIVLLINLEFVKGNTGSAPMVTVRLPESTDVAFFGPYCNITSLAEQWFAYRNIEASREIEICGHKNCMMESILQSMNLQLKGFSTIDQKPNFFHCMWLPDTWVEQHGEQFFSNETVSHAFIRSRNVRHSKTENAVSPTPFPPHLVFMLLFFLE